MYIALYSTIGLLLAIMWKIGDIIIHTIGPYLLSFYRRILTKQYKAQMRRKSQQIQEALVRTTCICLHVKYP